MTIGPWEIVILLVILVIIFGAGRLSQVGGAMGKSVRDFRHAVQDDPSHQTATAAAVTITAPPVTCPACQMVNPSTNKFCSACGGPLTSPAPSEPAPAPAAEIVCPSCATVNPGTQAFCGQCGTRLTLAA